jgi:integrase
MPDGRRLTFYGETEEDAERQKQEFIHSTEAPEPEIDSRITLHEFAKQVWYLTFHFLADDTKRAYESTYVNHIRTSPFAHQPISEIRFDQIQRHINWLSEQGMRGRKGNLLGKPLGPKKVAEVRERIISIFDMAVAHGIAPYNPAKGTKGPKKPPKRRRVLTLAKALEISEGTRGTRMHAPVVLASVLGLRRGEISGLRWSDLDRHALTLTVFEQVVQTRGGAKRSDVKTEAGRRVLPLTQELVAIIDASGNLDHDYIAGWKGMQWLPPDKITSGWIEIRDRFGLSDWHFHDLRHGAASILHTLKVDLVTISRILGHSRIDATLLYTDAHEETVRAALGDVAKAFTRR